jgi:GNAT superfamily N-acetyltransferase
VIMPIPFPGAANAPPGSATDDMQELYLDVTTVDTSAWAAALARAAAQGIVFTTLAEEERRDPGCLQKLYALAKVVHQSPTWTLDEYLERFDDREAVFIAQHGAGYVGYSYLVRDLERVGWLNQCMTGVLPEWRRRGIAIALKVHGATFARERGYTTIVTRIRRANVASLELNSRSGFQPWGADVSAAGDPPCSAAADGPNGRQPR